MVWMQLSALCVFRLLSSSSIAPHSLLTSRGRYLIVAASFVLQHWKGSSLYVFLLELPILTINLAIIVKNFLTIKIVFKD